MFRMIKDLDIKFMSMTKAPLIISSLFLIISLLSISKKVLSKFTDELQFQINDVTGIKDIVIKCRTYNEAKMMEVIEFQNFHKDLLSIFKLRKINFEKDERLQWNLFMNQFLNYSILHGRAIENYLPSWVQ